jgi:tetratricopeptide (TPR) repeat protein
MNRGSDKKPGALFRKQWILAGALIFSALFAPGQNFRFTPACEKASVAIMNFCFTEAKVQLNRERSDDPSNLLPLYYENYIDFLILFTGESRVLFDQMKDRKGARISALEQGDRSSPYYRLCLAEVNIQWAFVRIKFHEYTAAALELRKAYELLNENQVLFPRFLPTLTGLGLLHTLIGVIPENYKWLATLIGFRGSVEEGIAELAQMTGYQGTDPFCLSQKPYSCLLSAIIDVNLRKDKRSAISMISQFSGDPRMSGLGESPLAIYAATSVFLKNGRNGEALLVFRKRVADRNQYPLWFLSYMEGIARLNDLDTAAIRSFSLFLENFRGINYVKSSWQKVAWAYLIAGDTADYRRNIAKAATEGSNEVDEDKQAYSEAVSGLAPSIPLLKARLLFDGGYYGRALDELLDTRLNEYIRSRKDLTEYYYRLGRIYHEQGQTGKAIANYRNAIVTGKSLPQYYAAGAALQLGTIYESAGHPGQADSCYRLCLSMPFKEYRNSLGQKARAGLERIKESRP